MRGQLDPARRNAAGAAAATQHAPRSELRPGCSALHGRNRAADARALLPDRYVLREHSRLRKARLPGPVTAVGATVRSPGGVCLQVDGVGIHVLDTAPGDRDRPVAVA